MTIAAYIAGISLGVALVGLLICGVSVLLELISSDASDKCGIAGMIIMQIGLLGLILSLVILVVSVLNNPDIEISPQNDTQAVEAVQTDAEMQTTENEPLYRVTEGYNAEERFD